MGTSFAGVNVKERDYTVVFVTFSLVKNPNTFPPLMSDQLRGPAGVLSQDGNAVS